MVSGSSRKFVKELLKDPEVARKILVKYIEVRESLVELYQPGGKVDQYADQIRVSANNDNAKWGGAYVTYFDEEAEALKEWIAARIQYMDSYIPTLIGEHYTLTLDYANGSKLSEVYALKGQTIEVPKAKAENYEFLGWYYTENGVEKQFTKDTKVEKDMFLTAKWLSKEDKSFLFTLDAQGGTLKGSKEYEGKKTYSTRVEEDTQIRLYPKAVRKGYYFEGWFFDKEGTNEMMEGGDLSLEEDTTLYARWKKITVSTAKGITLKKTGRNMTVKISKVSGAKGYEVMYGTNKKFVKAKKKIDNN